jgi:hypothetical protein
MYSGVSIKNHFTGLDLPGPRVSCYHHESFW